MKAFSFRLAVVLQARERALEQARFELGQAQGRLQQAEDALSAQREALTVQLGAGPQPNTTFEAQAEVMRQRYIYSLRQAVERCVQAVSHAERAVSTARTAATEAHRAVRALELLREKEEAEWRLGVKRAEEKQTDESNAQRFRR